MQLGLQPRLLAPESVPSLLPPGPSPPNSPFPGQGPGLLPKLPVSHQRRRRDPGLGFNSCSSQAAPAAGTLSDGVAVGVGAEHGHGPPPRPAHGSKGFDLDDLGAAELEDSVLWECHLLGGGEGGLLVSAAPQQGSVHAGLGPLLWDQRVYLRSLRWPGAALGSGECGAEVGSGSGLGQAGVTVGSLVIGVGPVPKFGDGIQRGSECLGESLEVLRLRLEGGLGRLGGAELGSAGVGSAGGVVRWE